VVLEKRLGILQLCLLLAVLVFMTLTRGSRGEHASVHRVSGSGRPMGMREWGRRTLSISGDWVSRFRSPSPTPKPVTRPESRQSDKAPGTPSIPGHCRHALTLTQYTQSSSPLKARKRPPPTAPSSAAAHAPRRSPAPQRGTSAPARARRPPCACPRRASKTTMREARRRRRPPPARR